ncbi:MAG TPA: NfeD family protein [Acidimicrobiia bacterium]|nr:NfeD family protein [Acidimicrobiia bacterium]
MTLVLDASSSGAEPAAGPRAGRRGIDVVQVEGYFDPPNESLVMDAIAQANEQKSTLLVLQVDSSGAIDAGVRDVVRAIQRSRVPVAVWVGPSGADAKGATTLLLEAAHLAYVSPGSGAGPAHPVRLDEPGASSRTQVSDQLAALATRNGRDPDGARKLTSARLGSTAAKAVGATNGVRPTIGELIVQLDGETVQTAAGDVTLSTAKVIGAGRDRRRQPNQEVRFNRLDLGGQLLHRLISPSIAYFLFVAGLGLLVFEFYTASIGLAGLVGAICVIGAFVGFSYLPVNGWAFGLLVLAALGFAIDAQAGSLGFWTIVAAISLGVGSLFLYGGSSALGPPWWVLLVVCGGMLLFMIGGMTAMIRARFSTPTVGREGMIGETGEAEVDVAPDGVVVIRGARWRARTNRATPILAGGQAKVVAVEGLVLEVEPLEGAARDYRDRARKPG